MQPKRTRLGAPLNLVLRLEDGRILLVKRGKGKTMVARQKWDGKGQRPEGFVHGEQVRTEEGKDGLCTVMQVEKLTRKDVTFRILHNEPA